MKKRGTANFKGKDVLVLGLAKSGVAVAKLLSRLGANVIVNERKSRQDCIGVSELEAIGIQVVCGGHPQELLDKPIFMIVKNPGIPFDIPFLLKAEEKNIPVVTEVEVAYLISSAPMIGVTGSNGKTTTTTLIYHMLHGSGRNPLIAGNIGTVLCEVAQQAKDTDVIVAELSSFQLLGTEQFVPQIALLLNIFDAHLDYHHTKEHYIQAKAKLFANQTRDQVAVFNYDQKVTIEVSKHVQAQVVWFSRRTQVPRGSFLRDNGIYYAHQDGTQKHILDLSELKLMGSHNVENVLAAVAVAIEAGAKIEQIREVLRSFKGVPHRLQFVNEVHGVRYYNDSKATNSLATLKAIQSFPGSVVLIAGGLDRGENFLELKDVLSTHVKALIAYGQMAEKISSVAHTAGVNQIIRVDTVKDAVRSASELAQMGDVVLLSPAAASWDQFNSFEERGDMFTESVHMLR